MQQYKSIIDNILMNKTYFAVVFFCIFTLSYGVLYALDFYPEPQKTEAKQAPVVANTVEEAVKTPKTPIIEPQTMEPAFSGVDTLPKKLSISKLDREVAVLNPASNSVAALDAALLKGVIRHPDSAALGEDGNMFILGHSSYLPTVHNRNFQALNGVQNLKWGDTIVLSSDDAEYTYRVEKTYKVKATGFTVPIAGKGKTLTLVTCNSFATTDDRYVVEATLIDTKPL